MKIERLSVSGLRSHRGNPPTELVLGDRRLVAIVGHTGAGKSSLLEAITFALLFGEATYGGKAYEELSSDGRSEITVQLEFTLGDDRYQLLRTVGPDRNGRFGKKALYLRRIDAEGNIVSQTERVRDVDKVVMGLLGGMNREQFCQAVLLAQNRFAALLEANPAQREALLDTLLGLNSLHDARTALQKTRTAAEANIRRLVDQRALLPENPAAEAKTAKARSKAMAEIESQAVACGTRLNEIAEQTAGLSQQAADLKRAAQLRATATGLGGLERLELSAATVASLCELDAELSDATVRTTDALEKAQQALVRTDETFEKAQDEHGAASVHLIMVEKLASLAELLEEKPGIETRLQDADQLLTGLREEMAKAGLAAEEVKVAAGKFREGFEAAETTAHNATAAFERREQALADVARLVQRVATQTDSVEEAAGELSTARLTLEKADEALRPLAARVEAASTALDAAQRAAWAASAAHGCHPGEDCPVCRRTLPDTWSPPPAGDLDEARQALEQARTAQDTAARAHRHASDARGQAAANLRSALGSVASTADDLVMAATDHGPAPPPLPGADLVPDATADDDVLETAARSVAALSPALSTWLERERQGLEPLRQAKADADVQLQDAGRALKEAEDRQHAAEGAVSTLKADVAGAEGTRSGAATELVSCDQRLSSTLGQVDERWSALVDLAVPASLQVARQRLAADLAAVEDAVSKRDQASAAVRDQQSALAELARRRTQEISPPLAAERATLEGVAPLVTDLCIRLEIAVPAPAPAATTPAELRDSATTLQTTAQNAIEIAGLRLEELRQQVDALVAPASEVVTELVGLVAQADPEGTYFEQAPNADDPLATTTRDVVQRVIGGAHRMAADAANAAQRAAEDVRKAKGLDQRISGLQSWSADLSSAIEVLRKENFPKWARGVKIADLVDIASGYLSEMTDSRFRFDPTLQISDELAGVVRKASTLSGGEKFEASLALALGVSEIAGRSGVRIDTLFLDEGFAGLDQSHLNRALDALDREVAAGRSIVLITHIGAVAERIQDVLLIQPDGAGGSTIKWLDEDERFQLGADLDLAVP